MIILEVHGYDDKNAFDELIIASEIVVQARINSSRVNYEFIGGKSINCGISYTVNIVKSFKGALTPASIITIFGWQSLKTDAEYLLFLTTKKEGALSGTPKAAKMKCLQHVAPIRFSAPFHMEIFGDRDGKGHPGAQPPLLAQYEDYSFPIPPEVEMVTRKYEHCEMVDNLLDSGKDKCSVYKTASFLHWNELSDYIEEVVLTESSSGEQ